MLVESFPVGPLQCNCTILACPDEKRAVIVDPGGDPERILQIVKHYGLEVAALIHTHAHFDHILATRDIKEATGAAILLHSEDQWLYENIALQGAMFGIQAAPTLPLDGSLEHDQQIQFGRQSLTVLHTPGHTPGSVCFSVGKEQLLLAGDTLFLKSIGRTDLWGGSQPDIVRSIRERLFTLPDDTQVICGHGPATRIGEEKRNNPFVGAQS